MGGMFRPSLSEEAETMIGYFLTIALVLLSVYVSRIPPRILKNFKTSSLWQVGGFLVVILLTHVYGWIVGILAGLAYALILSRSFRYINEGMVDFVPTEVILNTSDTVIVPENHRWWSEKVLGENPFLIREKEVKTSAVQDDSERSMGSSTSTR
jgi:Na+/proline symporter